MIANDIQTYNTTQSSEYVHLCTLLSYEITKGLPNSEQKIWHGHPVWFLDGNPITGYAVRKNDIQLLFWSGQSFTEPGLQPEGKFKAAEARYITLDSINTRVLRRWLKESQTVQWDYKNIIKRRGVLERL